MKRSKPEVRATTFLHIGFPDNLTFNPQLIVDVIWTSFNDECYLFFTQNCQNFVHMLHSSIAVGISDAEKKLWARIPDPISYRLADISQATLGGRAALGARAAYLAAVADQAVPVGMAAESAGAIGTVGVTSGGAASGGTAAAGGTSIGSGAAASVTTTAEGAGTASTAGGVSSQAAGVTQTAATGTAQSSVTSTVGTAKGAAAGGTSAGKAGIGAKFAGLGQGAMHGAGAAKVGALAKVGTVAAFAHPVTGVVMTGGLIYLAVRGKRGKNWKPGSKKDQSLEKLDDPSVSDMLVAEDEFWDQAENPDKTMEEDLVAALEHHDQKVDEDLAEDLKLSLVTTEPTTIPEEMSLVGGAVPVGEGTKRSHTTV